MTRDEGQPVSVNRTGACDRSGLGLPELRAVKGNPFALTLHGLSILDYCGVQTRLRGASQIRTVILYWPAEPILVTPSTLALSIAQEVRIEEVRQFMKM